MSDDTSPDGRCVKVEVLGVESVIGGSVSDWEQPHLHCDWLYRAPTLPHSQMLDLSGV